MVTFRGEPFNLRVAARLVLRGVELELVPPRVLAVGLALLSSADLGGDDRSRAERSERLIGPGSSQRDRSCDDSTCERDRVPRVLSRAGWGDRGFPFGRERSVFKVAGKLFALSAHLPCAYHAGAAGDLRRS
jgi:hypothetical protein